MTVRRVLVLTQVASLSLRQTSTRPTKSNRLTKKENGVRKVAR